MEDKVKNLVRSIIALCSIFFFFFSLSMGSTILELGLYKKNICLSSRCLALFSKDMEGVILATQAFGWLLTTFVTIYGVVIALRTYYSGVQNNHNTNYTAHLTMFRDFANVELLKRNSIHPEKINMFKWYAIMFPLSRKGEFQVSEDYKNMILNVQKVIEEANSYITDADKDYKYRTHQRNLIKAFCGFGVEISNGPKNTFVEIEAQVFNFIDAINLSFTDITVELSKIERRYI